MGADAFTTMSQPSVSRFFEIITKMQCAILHNILVDQGYPPERGLDENDIGRYMDNNNDNHVYVGVLHPAEMTDIHRRRLGLLARLNMINNYCN